MLNAGSHCPCDIVHLDAGSFVAKGNDTTLFVEIDLIVTMAAGNLAGSVEGNRWHDFLL
jgi:hypothetical protein